MQINKGVPHCFVFRLTSGFKHHFTKQQSNVDFFWPNPIIQHWQWKSPSTLKTVLCCIKWGSAAKWWQVARAGSSSHVLIAQLGKSELGREEGRGQRGGGPQLQNHAPDSIIFQPPPLPSDLGQRHSWHDSKEMHWQPYHSHIQSLASKSKSSEISFQMI